MTKQENPEYKESIEHTQEQAIAAWVTVLNQIRINEIVFKRIMDAVKCSVARDESRPI